MPVKKASKCQGVKVLFIVGPTAIGKTRIAVKIAKRINSEIISADSMQVYKNMPILSQAPTAQEKKGITHHLIGILSPEKEYSAAIFRKKATPIIDSAIKRRKIPIVAGGSGLYIKALIVGLFPSPEADLKFRLKMEKFASRYGKARLYQKLLKIDREAAASIHPNDMRRIIRALEIHHLTGRTMTILKSETKGLRDSCDIKLFALTAPRDTIYLNINRRVDEMFRRGLVNEVKRLKRKALSKTARAVLGYKEVSDYLDGKYSMDTAKETLKMNTRRFAKRQMTWFRADKQIEWIDVSKVNEGEIVRTIRKAITKKSDASLK